MPKADLRTVQCAEAGGRLYRASHPGTVAPTRADWRVVGRIHQFLGKGATVTPCRSPSAREEIGMPVAEGAVEHRAAELDR